MSNEKQNQISFDIGAYHEAANTLVTRISNGFGGFFAPMQRVRMEKAESEAMIHKVKTEVEIAKIRAAGEVEVHEVQQRALQRLAFEEGKRQEAREHRGNRSECPSAHQRGCLT